MHDIITNIASNMSRHIGSDLRCTMFHITEGLSKHCIFAIRYSKKLHKQGIAMIFLAFILCIVLHKLSTLKVAGHYILD